MIAKEPNKPIARNMEDIEEIGKEKPHRIAVVNAQLCKPKKCGLECKKSCPVNYTGKRCIEVTKTDTISSISESLCIGCGRCAQVCPFKAIQIINLPKELTAAKCVFTYGKNSFNLYNLPLPKKGKVLGLLGANGVGKSTTLDILTGRLAPNLGKFGTSVPDIKTVLQHFRGSTLKTYLEALSKGEYRTVVKTQKSTVETNSGKSLLPLNQNVVEELDLQDILQKDVKNLSGGEAGRLAIGIAVSQKADLYVFDEPTSFLDVKQRIKVAKVISNLVERGEAYVVLAEHDLSIMDYLADYITVVYGKPGAYGANTKPQSTRAGINQFLKGFLTSDNLRFRDHEISFTVRDPELEAKIASLYAFTVPKGHSKLETFTLTYPEIRFTSSYVTVIIGENGIGKTTYLRHLAKSSEKKVSYKPQHVAFDHIDGSVEELLTKKGLLFSADFKTTVLDMMNIKGIMQLPVSSLSGGETQRLAIALCLGKFAEIYILDEPSAYLDVENRAAFTVMIRRFAMNNQKTVIMVEHDISMITNMADNTIFVKGTPGIEGKLSQILSVEAGLGQFLSAMDVTMHADERSGRPRLNKKGGQRDKEQKRLGIPFATC